MLLSCNKCRTTKDVRLRVDNPKHLKLTAKNAKDPSVSIEPVCTNCGTVAVISPFTLNLMVEKHDFLEDKTNTSKSKCHACDSNQEIKLDKQTNPRCMRCGGVVKMNQFSLKLLVADRKKYMSDEELAKWNLPA